MNPPPPIAPLPLDPDCDKGLYDKYLVTRLDDETGKHDHCRFFVLDVDHDPYAIPALLNYVAACKATHPQLALDLLTLIGSCGEQLLSSPVLSLFSDHVAGTREGYPTKTKEERFGFVISEIGELARELLGLSGQYTSGLGREELLDRVGEEIYDSMWNLADLALILGIDLDAALRRKASKNSQRIPHRRLEGGD